MSQANSQKLDLAYNKMRKKAQSSEMPKERVGSGDAHKSTQTRLDMKVMKQRNSLGYEKLVNQTVGRLEANLKGAMKAQGSKFADVPRHLGRNHAY